jgi:DNA/RNA endonuclease YhcR with UshA esterase domain
VTLTLASPLAASTAYTVKVNNVQDTSGNPIAANSTVAFTTGGGTTGFSVVAAFQFGADYVGVAFSEKVNAAQATTAANYSFSPALTITSVTMQENGQTAIIKTSAALPKSTAYTLTVSGVTSLTGGALSGGTANFTTVTETVVNIATIQNATSTYSGQSVTMIGQVYITASSNGTTTSAFIQDGSGRGLNVFGGSIVSALDNRGNVVKVTGTVTLYFTTTEVTPFTATLLTSGVPKLAPKVLTVAQMKSSAWEGTYIQTTATLTAAPSASGSSNYNYVAGDITFRVRNATGINAANFASGDVVTAAGFGSAFGSGASLTYQIGVGNADEFTKGSGPGDTVPPTLVSATGASGASSVSVTFSEAMGTGAGTAANYSVYPTATPASTISVSSASVSLNQVTLTLASPLAASTAYTVKVSNVQDLAGNPIAANSTVAFNSGGGATSFTVVAAFQFGSDYVGVAFSEKVNAAQATTAANYSFSPTLAIASVTMQENGQTAIIKTSAALPKSTAYTLTVSGVTSLTGGALSGGTANFSTVAETVTNIATIQGSTSTYAGQSLTMIGQVYVTASSNGTTTSAFIQDGSGRGLNVFGGSIKPALDDRGNVAKVTGVVELYFTTTEITGYTATLLTSGVPRLAPKVLTVAQMKSSAWEGTYIQTTATLTAAPSASGSSNYNYTAGDVIFRVRNASGVVAANFASGDVVTAAGFGSAFGSGSTTTYQIGVGHSDNFTKGGGPGDTTPPTLSSATGAAGSKNVTVMFSEALGTGANVAANYSVYPTATPASPISVSSASFAVNQVTLTLASALVGGTAYTVQVSNVQDLAGNSIAAGSVAQFTAGAAVVSEGLLDVPARTLLRGYVMPNGAEQAIEVKMNSEGSAKATCRVFDLQGRVVKVLYDGVGAKRTLKWNGRDETFEFVRAGLYICHLMTTSLDGTIRREQVPIVVSVRLD